MNISINKDIERYKESIVMGLTAKQLICSVIALALGAGIVLSTYKHVGINSSSIHSNTCSGTIALNGFYEYQGMSFTEMMKRKFRCLFMSPQLTYISEEGEEMLKELQAEELNKQKIADKKSRKLKNGSRVRKKDKGYVNDSRVKKKKRKDG